MERKLRHSANKPSIGPRIQPYFSGMGKLLMPDEVDRLFRYPRGRAARLARAGKIPFIKLPDGAVRFDPAVIARLIEPAVPPASAPRSEIPEMSMG